MSRSIIIKRRLRKLSPNNLFKNLPEGDAKSGLILILCVMGSLALANSAWSSVYVNFWNKTVTGEFTVLHLVNDGLMTIFFAVVGLEIKKEMVVGELSNFRKALLPFLCAIGGIIAPALIYAALNYQTENITGWAIPTATDIAFSIGILALLGSSIPRSLKVFLTALAIIDDLGAVVVIALFYSQSIDFYYVMGAILLPLGLWLLERYTKFYHISLWAVVGAVVWYLLHYSGIHATIAGVLIAAVTPIRNKNSEPLEELAHLLHQPVNKFIVPLFAIANTAIVLNAGVMGELLSGISLGIMAGLIVGKPLGIMLIAFISTKIKLTELPNQVSWKLLFGTAILAGIGFTMSLFVSFLAFSDAHRQDISKIAILIGSVMSGVLGLIYLSQTLKQNASKTPH
ncbi:Na+:H+ antiporter, NhaA family [Flexibacter flexilis DSM 6793]|uniref:Na(+)/H(+) antiporter NhaA n=1 Tax=Flexibacter flexilis DSM 6793 TaxID=927664 RepID=A0A1I1MHZ0_9BACT|nr:Na+/H+ antiporter NhaA [Flexibacter flexilis]SFC82738.1 Na+:H+ antiporter, NhaA family [Flexibacter flexilis DSM 6793]